MRSRTAALCTLTAVGLLASATTAIAQQADGRYGKSTYNNQVQPVAGYYTAPQGGYGQPAPPKPKKKKPVKPWKGLFFDNDFSYANDPNHTPLWGEELKDINFDDGLFKFSFGGELRHRPMNENNRLRPGGPGRSTYNLWRWRNYLDVQAGDWGRAYIEFIDGSVWGADLPKLPIDVNRWNVQNAFLDFNLDSTLEVPGTLRVGRQEMLYGKQRLISPLDWSNTRRNWEGVKYFMSDGDWDVHAFAMNPVNAATRRKVGTGEFDSERDVPDYDQVFSGVYSTYHGFENTTVETYWLWLADSQAIAGRADGRRHTVGTHISKTSPVIDCCGDVVRVWDFDMEGGYQFGSDNGERVNAGFFTTILGHTWKKTRWQPRVSGLFYWGSGDSDANDNENNTFDVLYPLGHAYWGILDNLSGQNLLDYSLQFDVKPTKKLKTTVAWHWFDLATDNDVVYNIAGVPLGTANTGTNIGNELDLIGTYTFSPNLSVQLGYSWFWYGEFIDNNLPRDTSTQAYVQTQLRY